MKFYAPCSLMFLYMVILHYGVLCGCASDALSEDRLDLAINAWEQQQTKWKDARYRLEGTAFVPKWSRSYPDGMEKLPETDHQFPHNIELSLDFAHHRARRRCNKEVFDLSLRKFVPEVFVDLFDGMEYQEYVPRGENLRLRPDLPEFNNELVLRGRARTSMFFRAEEIPLLLSHGFVPVDVVEPSLTPAKLDRRRFHLAANDAALAAPGSPFVLRIDSKKGKPERYSEITVRPDKGYAITREVRFLRGMEYWRVDVEVTSQNGEWQPTEWRIISSDVNGVLDGQDDFRVVEAEFDAGFPSDHFHQEPKPGMVVKDLRAKKRYVVGQAGERDIPVHEFKLARHHFPMTLVLNVVVVVGLIAALAARFVFRRMACNLKQEQGE